MAASLSQVYYYHAVTRQTTWIKPPPEFPSVPTSAFQESHSLGQAQMMAAARVQSRPVPGGNPGAQAKRCHMLSLKHPLSEKWMLIVVMGVIEASSLQLPNTTCSPLSARVYRFVFRVQCFSFLLIGLYKVIYIIYNIYLSHETRHQAPRGFRALHVKARPKTAPSIGLEHPEGFLQNYRHQKLGWVQEGEGSIRRSIYSFLLEVARMRSTSWQ